MVSLSTPTNWSRTCAVWIEEIRVVFEAPVPVTVGTGGFLRSIRKVAALLAAGVSLSFTLHCTRPPVVSGSARTSSSRGAGSRADGAVFEEEGLASWYGGNGDGFEGKPTANGESFDPEALTAAHKTLPLGTILEVENLDNGKKVLVRVNDRGPFVKGRILDLSRRGAKQLGFIGMGTAQVRIRTVDGLGNPAPIDETLEKGNPYVIQVAALTDPKNIEALRRELEPGFAPVTLQDAILRDGREIKRVRVGAYGSKADAEKAANELARRLKDRGVEPFITRKR
ncbi:MAG TPA: septal ring lytic transglycosylase RlpA family protein [Holophagaceae bacterium]|nr:septal ring lytic transglycosylase RlpA family protein [Holophagaceae bacterium]